jgi:molybdate transport system permease protein
VSGLLTPEEWEALALSLKVSAWATVLSLPFGLLAAWLLARRRFPGWGLFNALVHLPLVLPPVVTGYGLLLLFGRNSPLGQLLEDVFGVTLAFRWTGAVLAAAVMSFPLLVRALRLGFEAVNPDLEDAAATLGAPPPLVFLTVTLPLILPAILAGSVLAFAKAMGEFGATITFVANIPGQTQTLPTAIYSLLQVPGQEGAVWRLAGLSLVLSFGALLASEHLARAVARRIGGRDA